MYVFRMRSEGFSFYFGGQGVGTCSLDAAFTSAIVRNRLNRSQPAATLGNRSQPSATVRHEVPMAVPMGSTAKLATFRGFKRRVTSFRVAGLALRDIPTCAIMCQKSFCVTGEILLHRFQKMTSIFRGRRSTLEMSINFAWQVQHFRHVVLRVFANRMPGLRQVVTTCANCAADAGYRERCPFCVAGAAFSTNPSCVECHFAWQVQYLGHSTLYTLQSAQYTLHFTLHTLHSTLY